MAKRFLTHVDMSGNQIVNAAFEKLSADPNSGNFEGRLYYNTVLDVVRVYDGGKYVDSTIPVVSSDPSSGNYEGRVIYNTTENMIKSYDGSQWLAAGTVLDIVAGTDIDVTASAGIYTISLESTISSDTTGTAASATFATTASVANSVAANSVVLGTDTTGDYVASVSASDGISATGTGEGASVSLTNTDKGSSQNIFKTIESDSGSISASSNSASVTISGGTGISTSVSGATLTVTNDGVLAVEGTANQISASTVSGSVTLSLPNAVTFPGTVTLNADPQNPLEAATKQYVDSAVSGLDWHTAVNLLATSNIALTGTSGTLVIDGHAALDDTDDGYRLLLKNQTTGSENGIYVYADDGSTYTLSRAVDADTYQELIGAAVFVMEGTTYASTAWVQTNHYLTSFSGQTWSQFSGSGTYVAGNGLTLTGNSFSIDTSITVDHNTAQTLTNKTLTSPTITSPTVSGLYLSDNNIVIEGTANVHETTLVFTDPTADRTITFKDESGTVALTSDITSALSTYTRKYSQDIGNASLTSIPVVHNLGTRDVQVQVYDKTLHDTVECDVVRTDTNTITVSFAVAPAVDAYRVVVVG